MATKTIDVLDMGTFLGSGIQVYFKNDDWGVHFKPMELINGDTWKGETSGGLKMTINRDDIDFIRY